MGTEQTYIILLVITAELAQELYGYFFAQMIGNIHNGISNFAGRCLKMALADEIRDQCGGKRFHDGIDFLFGLIVDIGVHCLKQMLEKKVLMHRKLQKGGQQIGGNVHMQEKTVDRIVRIMAHFIGQCGGKNVEMIAFQLLKGVGISVEYLTGV